MDRGRFGRGRRGGDDFGGRGGRGRGGRGRGTPLSREAGAVAVARVLEGLTLSVTPSDRLSPDDMRMARRPDEGGQAGRVFEVLANFFLMKVGVKHVYHYDVDIKGKDDRVLGEGDVAPTGPQLLPIQLCRAIVTAAAQNNRWPPSWVYDGKKNIYTTEEFFSRQKTIVEVNMSTDDRPKIYEVGIKWAASINMDALDEFYRRRDLAMPREAIQSLEVCLRFSAANNPHCHLVGRSIFFDNTNDRKDLPNGAELWPGYHQGIKLCQHGLAVNIEVAQTAFIKKAHVIEFLQHTLNTPLAQWRQWPRDKMIPKMSGAMSNILVSVTHRRGESRKFRCRGVREKSSEEERFTLKDGTTLTVADYWSQKYGRLREPWLPCLDVSKGRKINYLPMEVCEIVPGQRLPRLNEDQTRTMIRFTAMRPQERQRQTLKALSDAGFDTELITRSFRININKDMIRTKARILPQPYLEYESPPCMDTGDAGAWNLENVRFFRAGTIRSWSIVSSIDRRISLSEGEQGLPEFTTALIKMLESMGMQLPPGMPPLVHQETKSVDTALKSAIQEAENVYQKKPDLILYLLRRKETHPYQEVKRIAERDLGVTTQCFVATSAGIGVSPKGRMQYLANLAMKINHKVGGVNTQIMSSIANAFPILGLNRKRPFIVFGADVTHPSGFDVSEPSVGAVVASMDPYLGQFAARVMAMGHREEKMSMQDAVVDLFKQFFQLNKVTPEAVFFYRDGVSEGQFQEVLEHEYGEIRKACFRLSPSYNPPITLVVVQKSHHTRFYPTNESDGDRNGNIKPGTCVDTGITANYEFDFYLNSHAGIQGTNKPAHYYVLVDENGFGSDGMELFSYWMCYLYCRCTRSVSYVPPAYYAHLAALHGRYLVGQPSDSSSEGSNGKNRTSMFHEDLNQRMFFI